MNSVLQTVCDSILNHSQDGPLLVGISGVDGHLFDDAEKERALFNNRYKAGQEMYKQEVHPKALADIVINNSDYNAPVVVK